MADIHNRPNRRFNMQQIKGKNTQPEMLVRKFLFAHGYRYRLHVKMLPGKPASFYPNTKP
jgi:DNA mismatch endonuclease (patch repair protein)